MSEKVFKKISVVGTSTESYSKAVEAAVRKASDSVHGLSWFEVTEFRGGIGPDGDIEWQASVDVAFKVD